MLHTKFRGNRPAGSRDWRRRFLKGFFIIYGRGGHLGHVTSIMSSDFLFLVPESFHKNLFRIGTVVSEKIRFEFLYITTLGKGQEMTLTFNTHIPSYIQLDVCSYQLSGHWLERFLKNPLFSLFPIESLSYQI